LLAKNILGGWQVSGIFSYESGTPLGIPAVSDQSGVYCTVYVYNWMCNPANIGPGPWSLNWNGYYTGKPIFNVDKWSAPGAWTQGNAIRSYSALRYPWGQNENVALAKKLFFGERVTGELRVEFYNVLNRFIMCGNVDQNVADKGSGFGFYSSNGILGGGDCQGNTPRQGQAFFKITF
jgi:hypothetical protein